MYSKKTFLSTALDSRKYKGYSTTLPESHVPTIWANMADMDTYMVDTSSGSSCTIDIESQTKKLQKRKEIEANIPKRALMLEKMFADSSHIPRLPYDLWLIIDEYEGGVESGSVASIK
jgi:hypothetical protein